MHSLFLFLAVASAFSAKVDLPVGTPFNQKNTQYCWAYSAFHSLRTYYFHAQHTGADFDQWKKAIQDLNTPNAFREFIRAKFPNRPSEPMKFVKGLMKADPSLPNQGWDAYIRRGLTRYTIPFDPTRAKYLGIREIEAKIKDALAKGIPTAYCGNGHCTAIYGAVYDGDKLTKYLIADSVSNGSDDGRTYEKSAKSVLSSLEIILGRE